MKIIKKKKEKKERVLEVNDEPSRRRGDNNIPVGVRELAGLTINQKR